MLGLDDGIRIEKSDHRRAPYPGLQIGVREAFAIGRIDEHACPSVQGADLVVGHAAMEDQIRYGGRFLLDPVEQFGKSGLGSADHMKPQLRRFLRQRQKQVRPFELAQVIDPQHIDIAHRLLLRRIDQHLRHLAMHTVIGQHRLLLHEALRQDALGPAQSVFVQDFVAPVFDQEFVGFAVGVMRHLEHELASGTFAKHGKQSQMHAGATGVVDIGIRPAQRRPDTGPAWMDEAQHRESCLLTIRLVRGNAVPGCMVRLPVVEHHHAGLVTAPHQRLRQQCMLHLLATDAVPVELGREHRQVFQPEKADPHQKPVNTEPTTSVLASPNCAQTV